MSKRQGPTYRLCNGRIEIKPRLKYEISISLHVLKFAPDHHHLFVPWARQMRQDLSKNTLHDATTVMTGTHEWQLCYLVQDHDGEDTLQGIAHYITGTGQGAIVNWASTNGSHLVRLLGLHAKQFPDWYADFLKRYYEEGFGKTWTSEHRGLVHGDAESMAVELQSLDFSITSFMESYTGRRFSGSTKLVLYPSSFSRPQHAYGFAEEGHKVVVYKIGTGMRGVIGSAFHELMHPLIRGWWNAEGMNKPLSALAGEPLFRETWQRFGKGNYVYPEAWLDELVVHALSNYLEYKVGLATEGEVRARRYDSYEDALYDAMFESGNRYSRIDDFLFHAIRHIDAIGDGTQRRFQYLVKT